MWGSGDIFFFVVSGGFHRVSVHVHCIFFSMLVISRARTGPQSLFLILYVDRESEHILGELTMASLWGKSLRSMKIERWGF